MKEWIASSLCSFAMTAEFDRVGKAESAPTVQIIIRIKR
jgi:hypothetical protein